MATVTGTNASETLYDWSDSSDYIQALEGNDVIIMGFDWGNADHVEGGLGTDQISYQNFLRGVTINLFWGTADFDDTFNSIEDAKGTNYRDYIYGNAVGNLLYGLGGNDVISGGGGIDWLIGDAGNDELQGGEGADRLYGVDGFDWAVYTSSPAAVQVSLTSRTGVGGDAQGDRLNFMEALRGSSHNDVLEGDLAGNQLWGEGGSDTLRGLGGVDRLYGGGGADFLFGGDGNDLLEGGFDGSADTMYGGAANDTYVVLDVGDKAIEASGEGADHVQSLVSFSLGANVERLTLFGDGAINGAGNTLANTLTGNNAANVLTGYSGNDVLQGSGGNDTLRGAVGIDRLYGGPGADNFVFNVSLVAANRDTIFDFNRIDDTIQLENAIFTKVGAAGPLAASAFKLYAQAKDPSDRIIYNPASGYIYYDSDGSGAAAAIHFATLSTRPTITAADFRVI